MGACCIKAQKPKAANYSSLTISKYKITEPVFDEVEEAY